jgi:hypothetical protein
MCISFRTCCSWITCCYSQPETKLTNSTFTGYGTYLGPIQSEDSDPEEANKIETLKQAVTTTDEMVDIPLA